jgi:hypothetical protein|tara:strand:+ start:37 stop:1041 length:1005 start_codon:yes stop_codon:yes gene_type:complete
MATYLGTHGGRIQNYTTNPDNPNTGEVWYNATANTIKIEAVTTSGAWATGSTLNSARRDHGGNGTYTSALMYGGYTSTYVTLTESWNGTNWTEVNDLNQTKNSLSGAGADNTAAIAVGGFYTPPSQHFGNTELWNGTNWTEVNDLNTARYALGATGTSTAAIATGGNIPPNASTAVNESWNGTNWTEVNDLNTARESSIAANTGTQTAALFAGGQKGNPPPNVNTADVESWNGTNWTEVNNLNQLRSYVGNAGTQTSALAYGGDIPPRTALTEEWNGTNWTEVADLNTGRDKHSSPGTTTNALAVGGYDGSNNVANAEEWTGAGAPLAKTISTD